MSEKPLNEVILDAIFHAISLEKFRIEGDSDSRMANKEIVRRSMHEALARLNGGPEKPPKSGLRSAREEHLQKMVTRQMESIRRIAAERDAAQRTVADLQIAIRDMHHINAEIDEDLRQLTVDRDAYRKGSEHWMSVANNRAEKNMTLREFLQKVLTHGWAYGLKQDIDTVLEQTK